MANCPKCQAILHPDATRCPDCGYIIPVALGSRADTRYERVRRPTELVSIPCPFCGKKNPYTRFRCQSCNASLSAKVEKANPNLFWIVILGVVAVIAVVVVYHFLHPS